MKCPNCGYEEDKVIDSRPSEEGYAIREDVNVLNCKERLLHMKVSRENPYCSEKGPIRQNLTKQTP